jgi:8-oxo-dGTP diphosphatase
MRDTGYRAQRFGSKEANPLNHFTAFPRTLCFVQNGDDFLLLKGAPTKRLYADQYNGVGGHVERDEDVLTSLRREVLEETGLEIENPRLRAVIVADEGDGPGVLIFVYTAGCTTRVLRPSAEGELVWAPRSRLLDYDLVPDLRRLLPLVFETTGIVYGHYEGEHVRFQQG